MHRLLFITRYCLVAALALVPVLVPVTAQARNNFDELLNLSLEDLKKVEVTTASHVVAELRKQPVSMTTITRDKIQLSGARTLSELLTIFVPGYFLVEDQDDTIAGFRGLVADNNSKVMLLLNGTKMNAEWFWGAPDALLNGMDLGFIERIEIVRGPGSVTLGQGALLGAINIITKKADTAGASVQYQQGMDGLRKVTVDGSYVSKSLQAYGYFSDGHYDGQALRDEGWANARSDQGLSVFERQHRLKRSEYTSLFGNLRYGQFELDAYHFEQRRDLYNFYRDREQVAQTLDGLAGHYTFVLSEQVSLKVSGHYSLDDYELRSHGNNLQTQGRLDYETSGSGFASFIGLTPGLADNQVAAGLNMGGTREQRRGLKLLLSWDQLWPGNRLALGAEHVDYDYGQSNDADSNFIINEEVQTQGLSSDGMGGFVITDAVNDSNTWVKPGSVGISSTFLEDVYRVNERIDVFAALRFDKHPSWGSQVSPRLGAFYDIDNTHLFRLSWQTGFRGAVGVQFSGGFVQDGFLAEENFSAVNALATSNVDFDFDGIAANDLGSLQAVSPETIESLELAYSYTSAALSVSAVIFLNTVEDIITAQAHGYEGLGFGDSIGSDEIGTWGGSWYYQNQTGKLEQIGFELELGYRFDAWELRASHAHVEVASADAGVIGIYVLAGEKSAAYPEDVSRLHLGYGFNSELGRFTLQYNHLYYWGYDAPTGVSVDGNHMGNLGARWTPPLAEQRLYVDLLVKNLWDQNELYPINGTGNLSGADGAPALEERSWWLGVGFSF